MKFTVNELSKVGSYKWKSTEIDGVILRNIQDLILKVNALGFKPSRTATSCLRDIVTQRKVNPKAMGSSHLYGCAIDIGDSDHKLQDWLNTIDGQRQLIECGLWVEDFKYTKTWVHLQTYRPKSGKRFFIP